MIQAWILYLQAIEEAEDTNRYICLETSNRYFEALFIIFGVVRAILSCIRPFYTLDRIYTRSRYNLILLLTVGINTEDHVYPLVFALVPIENEH